MQFGGTAKRQTPIGHAPGRSPVKNKVVPEESSYHSSQPNDERKSVNTKQDDGPSYNSNQNLQGRRESMVAGRRESLVDRKVSGSSFGKRNPGARRLSIGNRMMR